MELLHKIGAAIGAGLMALGALFGAHAPAVAPTDTLGATATIETPVALFQTSLASSISTSATSMTLVSASTKDGTTLSGTYSFIIDEGTAAEEFVIADCTGTACTNMQRGLSVITGTTTIAALQQTHRRGASVKITDAPLLLKLTRIINGIAPFPNALSYASTQTIASSSNSITPASWVYGNFVNTSETQTVNGAKTFSATTTATQGILTTTAYACGTGSSNLQLCNKSYIDGVAVAGASNANTTTKGIVQEATQAEATAGTAAGSTGARLFVSPSSLATTVASLTHYITPYFATSTAYVSQAIPVVSGDVVQVWGQASKGSSCGGASFAISFGIRPSNNAATTTIDTPGANIPSSLGCTLTGMTQYTATTTQTLYTEVSATSGSFDQVRIMAQKIH